MDPYRTLGSNRNGAASGAQRTLRNYAEKRAHSQAGSQRGLTVRVNAGHQVCELHDVGRQEVDEPGIFYDAMKTLEEKGGGDDALKLFKKAVRTASRCSRSRPAAWAAQTTRCRSKSARSAHLAGHSLAHYLRPQPRRKGNDRQAVERAARCGQRARRGHEEEGRRAPHGRGQQGLRSLPLVGKQPLAFASSY